MLASGGRREGREQCLTKMSVLFRRSVSERNETKEYPFLQHMELTHPLDTGTARVGCVCIRWCLLKKYTAAWDGAPVSRRKKA